MSLATSLYDALTSIDIPNDKAREVVESLEQKMTADFASKADVATIRADIATVRTEIALVLGRLEQHEVATEAEFAALRRETKTEFAAVRGEMKAEFATLRSEMKAEFATVRSEMKALTFDITTRMGVLYVTATSFLLAVLKFT
jgi:ribosomal protein L29